MKIKAMNTIRYTILIMVVAILGASCKVSKFSKLPSGLQYKIIDNKKQPHAQLGWMVKLFLTYTTEKDSVVFSSSMIGEPAELPITAPTFKGDPMEGFMQMGAGDSAIFLVSCDSLFKAQPEGKPAYATPGSFLKLHVRMMSAMSQADYDAAKALEGQKQIKIDDDAIQNYLKLKGITAQKTASGLYYSVKKQGEGAKVVSGNSVTVNYTGMLTDGTIFDSSKNPGREPFEFTIGAHQVIAGWDEGIALFNVGGEGTLYIPSALGYGARGAGGAIPPNAILIFDIEVLGVK